MTWFTCCLLCHVMRSSWPQLHASLFAYCFPEWDEAVVSLAQGLLAQQSDQSGHWITPEYLSFRWVCSDIWHKRGLCSVTNHPSVSDIFHLSSYSWHFPPSQLLLCIEVCCFCPFIPLYLAYSVWLAGFYCIRPSTRVEPVNFLFKSWFGTGCSFFFMCTVSHWAQVAELHSIICTAWAISDFMPQIRLKTTSQQNNAGSPYMRAMYKSERRLF